MDDAMRNKTAVDALQENVEALIAKKKAAGYRATNDVMGPAMGLSSNTIGRMRRGDGSATVSTLEAVAAWFGLAPWMLLVPNLDPTNPPVQLTKAEQEVIQLLRKNAA